MYSLAEGRLHREGRPLRLLGANYLPAEAGCRMWPDWDLPVIRRDFAAMAAAGLNAVRIFVFWRDFAPAEDEIDTVAVAKLVRTAAAADEFGLACVISVFTIWMNGERLDLSWRSGRSLWRDWRMLAAGERLVRTVARELRDARSVAALDLGDEIAHVDPAEAAALTRAEVDGWYTRMATAVREERPGTIVLQANDASAVFGTTAFGTDNAGALDLVGVHAFPTWSPGGIESTLSYKATNLASFVARYASAYGPPLVDELGSYGVDEATATAYLGAAAVSALAGGAVGVFVWCWTEIVSTAEPYEERPAERTAGLVEPDGTAKPRLHAYTAIAARLAELDLDRGPHRVAIYLNDNVRARKLSYLDSDDTGATVPVYLAHLLLKRAHLDHAVVAGDALDDVALDLIVCPSVRRLTARDIRRLRRAAEGGATVYLSADDHLHGFPGAELIGADLVDFTLTADRSALRWDDGSWAVEWCPTVPSTMAATTAKVLATYPDGTSALMANAVGDGQVLFTNAPFERSVAAPGRLTSVGAETFYRMLAAVAGIRPRLACDNPDVEIVAGHSAGRYRAVLVNHAERAVHTRLVGPNRSTPVSLDAKGWTILDLGDGGAP